MKKLFLIVTIASILASCAGRNKNQYTVNGIVKGIDTGMVYLQKSESGVWTKLDSTNLKGGKFTFTGNIKSPEMWYLTFQGKQIYFPLFIENSFIDVLVNPDSIDKSTVKGSATQDIYKQYLTKADEINKKSDDLYTQYKQAKEKNDTVTMQKLDDASTQLDKEMKNVIVDFAKTNTKSVTAPYLIMRNSWQFELEDLIDIYSKFDTSLRSCVYYQNINNKIEVLKRVAIGQPAVDFTMNDSTGKAVTLSSLKGKILLVDFWASWCVPCRGENPNVVKAYQAYNKKGFDILGVSFDKDHAKWVKATKDDHLTWNHVSDLQGWGNAAGKLYGINSIPANVLLDKDQKIIAKNLRGEDLIKKLEELLGAPVQTKTFKQNKKK